MQLTTAQKTWRILIVDDHPVVREGLCSMLKEDPRLEIVGTADSGEAALEMLNQLEPDLVLMDILMPGMSGIELTRQIKTERPTTVVILLTMYDSNMYVVEGLRAGASGYLVKDSSPEFLRDAIDTALKGGTIVKSGLLHQAIKGILRGSKRSAGDEAECSVEERFTPRELDVLRLIAEGSTNRQIARNLSLAEITVKKHVQSIISKLGVSDRTQAAITAARLGLVQ